MQAEDIAKAINGTRFRYKDEKQLQHALGLLLTALGVKWEAEVVLGPGDRIDFIVEPGIGIEVKTDDSTGGKSLAAVTRQLHRYSQFETIRELILVTTMSKHRAQPDTMNEKPVYVVYLMNSFL